MKKSDICRYSLEITTVVICDITTASETKWRMGCCFCCTTTTNLAICRSVLCRCCDLVRPFASPLFVLPNEILRPFWAELNEEIHFGDRMSMNASVTFSIAYRLKWQPQGMGIILHFSFLHDPLYFYVVTVWQFTKFHLGTVSTKWYFLLTDMHCASFAIAE